MFLATIQSNGQGTKAFPNYTQIDSLHYKVWWTDYKGKKHLIKDSVIIRGEEAFLYKTGVQVRFVNYTSVIPRSLDINSLLKTTSIPPDYGYESFPYINYPGMQNPTIHYRDKDTIDTHTVFKYFPFYTTNIDTSRFFVKNNRLLDFDFDDLRLIQKANSDTLEVLSFGKIKFVKIGDRVYKIESPKLTEVEKGNDTIIWNGGVSLLNPSPYYMIAPNYFPDTTFLKRKP